MDKETMLNEMIKVIRFQLYNGDLDEVSKDQHTFHHNDENPRITVKVEKNSRGVNWEVSISNATDPDIALSLLHETETRIKAIYEPKPEPEKEEPLPF
jgi:hypothetical protein